jgi:hypothetical protein
MKNEKTPSHKKHRKKIYFWLGGILALLIVARLFLPSVILHFVNKKLANLQGYFGKAEDIHVALYRGAYVLRNIYLDKVDSVSKDHTEFFSSNAIDISVEWKALLHGKIVGEIYFEKPVLKYTLDKTVGKKREKDTVDFIQVIKDMVPLRINHFGVQNGQIHYIDPKSKPKVDIFVSNLYLEGRGLTNKPDPKLLLPAEISLHGNLYDGNLTVNAKLNPLTKIPTFDLNGTLTKTNLKSFNEFFNAYGNFSAKEGTMSLYTECAAKDNKFRGYVKPLIKDFKIEQGEGDFVDIVWEAFLGVAAKLLTNPHKDQIATKVPIEGEFTKPETGIPEAIGAVLKNAFVEALKPSIDNSINILNVQHKKEKNIFKRLFSNPEKSK